MAFEPRAVDVPLLSGTSPLRADAANDDKGRFYRAPSRAGPGNDINAGSAGFQEARHRGVLDKSESG
jgi:hypothetical protein